MKRALVFVPHIQPVLDVCKFVPVNVTKRLATNLTKICLLENYFNLKLVFAMNMRSLISSVVSREIIYPTCIGYWIISPTRASTKLLCRVLSNTNSRFGVYGFIFRPCNKFKF